MDKWRMRIGVKVPAGPALGHTGLWLILMMLSMNHAAALDQTANGPDRPAAQTIRIHDHSSATIRYGLTDGRWVKQMPAAPLAISAQPTVITPSAGGHGPVCGGVAVSWTGQTLPDGEQGTLDQAFHQISSTLNDHGRVAFFSLVQGAERNQGIFTADATGLRIVAMGCGGAGGSGNTAGCGDPSPAGGTFSGLFLDTHLTPAINNSGDVLFIGDIHDGDSPRGLFLHRAATDDIVKVAAVGDPSPRGGVLTELGPGVISNHGMVLFLARTDAVSLGSPFDILKWEDGKLGTFVANGDAAPGGGTFAALATELGIYADGTIIPGGPVPSINDHGQIAFRSNVVDGQAFSGLFFSEGGQHEWWVMHGTPTPLGGEYTNFFAPLLNNTGEIAFFAQWSEGTMPSHGWVAGKPGEWRQKLAASEEIDGGTVVVMAVSRNPINALHDNGDLALWVQREMPDMTLRDTLIVSGADGQRRVAADQGQVTPAGGVYGNMNGWPAYNNAGQIRLGAGTPGIPDQPSSEFVLEPCPPPPDALFGDRFEQQD